MAPQPKRKHSSGRRDRRRAHDALSAINLVNCPNCGEVRPSHTVCPNCGHYQGREVVAIEKEDKSK
jgi:large subunit ribosomal protein L32